MKLKKGDNVIVTAGKDRGREGKILKVLPRQSRIIVEGVNLFKRRIRPKRAGEKGQIVSVAYPLAAAKAMAKCGRCGRGVRLAYRRTDGKKLRVCRRCGQGL